MNTNLFLNLDTTPYYIENEGVGLNEIKYFVDYMMFQRTKNVNYSFEDENGQTSYCCDVEYFPLTKDEKFPEILFKKNILSRQELPIEYEGLTSPSLTRQKANYIKSGINGLIMEPLTQIAYTIEHLYNSGLKNGDHNKLHSFARELNKMFVFGVEIITWKNLEGKRFFQFKNNPRCEDPNYYYLNPNDEF